MREPINYGAVKWHEVFNNDPLSPSGLVWKGGKIAGCKHYKQKVVPACWVVCFKGTYYIVHRIIWCMINGEIDQKLVIDHINGNPFDNSLDNLRLVSCADNSRNMKIFSNNTTGHVGVCYQGTLGKEYYRAQITGKSGLRHRKAFSTNKYGDQVAFNLAVDWYNSKLLALVDENVVYLERHGK